MSLRRTTCWTPTSRTAASCDNASRSTGQQHERPADADRVPFRLALSSSHAASSAPRLPPSIAGIACRHGCHRFFAVSVLCVTRPRFLLCLCVVVVVCVTHEWTAWQHFLGVMRRGILLVITVVPYIGESPQMDQTNLETCL